MLICRKCQAQHDDAVSSCSSCGADLRRDGIRIASRQVPVASPSSEVLPPLPVGDPGSDALLPTPDASPAPDPTPAPPPEPALSPVADGRRRRDAKPSRSARGVEPGELAKRLAANPGSKQPSPGPIVRPDTTDGAADAERSRGRGVEPDEVRRPDDPDRPNVHGDGPPAAPPDEEAGAAPRPAREGEVACGRCLEPNQESRRFCQSCGEALPAFADRLAGIDDTEEDEAPPRNTLWRRLTGTTVTAERDNRTWKQRARDAGHGRIRYETGFSPAARMAMVGAGVAAVAAVALALGPGRSRLTGLLDGDPAGTSPASAELVGPQGEPLGTGSTDGSGFVARGAVDGDERSGVAFPLTPDGLPADVALILTLAEPTQVDELVVQTGLLADDEEVRLFPRPAQLEVCTDAGDCIAVPLEDTSGEQRVPVPDLPVTGSLAVRVAAVHLDVAEYVPLVVVREIRVVG